MSTEINYSSQSHIPIDEIQSTDPVSELYDLIVEFYITSKSLL